MDGQAGLRLCFSQTPEDRVSRPGPDNKGVNQTVGCTGWSAPLLFKNLEDKFSCVETHMIKQ